VTIVRIETGFRAGDDVDPQLGDLALPQVLSSVRPSKSVSEPSPARWREQVSVREEPAPMGVESERWRSETRSCPPTTGGCASAGREIDGTHEDDWSARFVVRT
jgi:hypothetical protein